MGYGNFAKIIEKLSFISFQMLKILYIVLLFKMHLHPCQSNVISLNLLKKLSFQWNICEYALFSDFIDTVKIALLSRVPWDSLKTIFPLTTMIPKMKWPETVNIFPNCHLYLIINPASMLLFLVRGRAA